MRTKPDILSGVVLQEDTVLTLQEVIQTCHIDVCVIEEMVDHGLLSPEGERTETWCFYIRDVQRIQVALRLQQDLQVNVAGAALALELLAELEALQEQLRLLK